MRLLLLVFFSLSSSLVYAQANELDERYTPPSKTKFSQAKAQIIRNGLFEKANDAPFLWAVKYDVTKALKNHHQFGLEMSVNDWLSFEPLIGVLRNQSDMYIESNNEWTSLLADPLISGFGVVPVSDLNYQSLLAWADPRSKSIPSFGFQVNLFNTGDRSFPDFAYTMQLGYQFQHMRYTLGESIGNNVFLPDSRDGFLRRQQLTLFLGAQRTFGDRLTCVVEYGLVAALNIFTAPTFSKEVMAGANNTSIYQKLDYANAFEPVVGLRVKAGFGYKP